MPGTMFQRQRAMGLPALSFRWFSGEENSRKNAVMFKTENRNFSVINAVGVSVIELFRARKQKIGDVLQRHGQRLTECVNWIEDSSLKKVMRDYNGKGRNPNNFLHMFIKGSLVN